MVVTTCHVDDTKVMNQMMNQVMYLLMPAVCRWPLLPGADDEGQQQWRRSQQSAITSSQV